MSMQESLLGEMAAQMPMPRLRRARPGDAEEPRRIGAKPKRHRGAAKI